MADDIRIRVGVQNNVRAGMDDVVRDVNAAGKRIQGKGFMEMVGKALRGDISGALADLQEKMGAGMKGLAGKAALWGGGIATAFAAGWKAGTKIDEFFGISDKVAKWWAGAAEAAGKAWDRFYKTLRAQRTTLESELSAGMAVDQKVFDIREKQKLKRMTPEERVAYYEGGIQQAERAKAGADTLVERAMRDASKASATPQEAEARKKALQDALKEREERSVMLEEMKAGYQDALDENSKAYAAAIKAEWQATQDAEQRKRDAAQQTADFLAEMADKNRAEKVKAVEAEIAAVEAAGKKEEQDQRRRADRRKALQEQLGEGRAGLQLAANRGDWRNAQEDKRAQARAARQRDNLVREAEVMEKRGGKLPRRWQDALDAFRKMNQAQGAINQIDALDQQAKQAQVRALGQLEKLNAELAKLNGNLQMGG